MISATHKELFREHIRIIYEHLRLFQENGTHRSDLTQFKKLYVNPPLPYTSQVEKEMLNELTPEHYGWGAESECPRLEWLAAVISSYSLYRQINVDVLIRFLKAINYYGYFDLFGLFHEINTDRFTIKEQFDYFKALAKHYKGKGELMLAQEYYRKALTIASQSPDKNLFPYALILLAKLYSDYWQRKGLQLAFNRIAFRRAKQNIHEDNILSRWYQICVDTYAKEIYSTNPILGEKLFRQLLRNKNTKRDTKNRIRFRYYECRISYFITKKLVKKLSKQLNEYEQLLQTINNNPKALFIRMVQLLGYYRKIIDTNEKEFLKDVYIGKRLNQLKDDEAINRLDSVIINSRSFNDIKFFALAYYEKSFWLKIVSENFSADLDKRIRCLEESYRLLSGLEKAAVNNKTYINVLAELGKLYVQKKKWDQALVYYNTLYEYLFFLTENLEIDKGIIDQFITGQYDNPHQYPEFAKLNKSELRSVRERLLMDYNELTLLLINYGKDIRAIQRQHFNHFSGLLMEHRDLITHDITTNIRGVENALTAIIENESQLEQINIAKRNIHKALENIRGYERLAIDEIISPAEIDIAKEVADYISFANKYAPRNVTIVFHDERETTKIQIRRFVINSLLVNVIENAIQAGQMNKIEFIRIEINLRTGIKDNSGVERIYLVFTDNCGSITEFETAIEKLNQSKTVPSRKHIEGIGKGLTRIRKTLNNFEWILHKTENLQLKSLWIPIC